MYSHRVRLIMEGMIIAIGMWSGVVLSAPQVLDKSTSAPRTSEASASLANEGQSEQRVSVNKAELTWASLSLDKQRLLGPLELEWAAFSRVQKKRWIALAKRYPTMSASQRERFDQLIHASLEQRRQLRMGFSKFNTLTPAEKRSLWLRYQALSPEEKEYFRKAAQVRAKSLDKKTMGMDSVSKSSSSTPSTNGVMPNLNRTIPESPAVGGSATR